MARTVPSSPLALLVIGLCVFAPLTLRADVSFGVAGMSVGPVKWPGRSQLPPAPAASSTLTSSLLIPQALAIGNFPVFDGVFAGQGVAANIPKIPASDFTVS